MKRFLHCCNLPASGGYVVGFNLKCKYLETFGFKRGDLVQVVLSDGKIEIPKVSNARK